MMQLLTEIMLLSMATIGILIVILATLYDIQKVRSGGSLRRELRRMTKRQPHISIVITQITSTEQLLECLRYIKKSRYKQFDVVAVTGRFRASQRKKVYAQAGLEKLRIYTPHRELKQRTMIANAYRRSERGPIVMILQADDLVAPDAMRLAVATMQVSKLVEGVRLFALTREPSTMTELHTVFSELGRRLASKAIATLGLKRKQTTIATGVYRYESIKTCSAVRTVDSLSLVAGHASYSHEWSRWPARIVFISIVSYTSIVAATLQSTWPLIMTWLIVCVWLLAVVWTDETTQLKRKLMISTGIPIGMFVITASYIVDGAGSIIRLKTF